MEIAIKGFEHHVVNEYGQVRNTKTNHILKPNVRKNGYYLMTVWEFGKGYKKYLHRIIAEAFIPNPDNKRTVNHKDGNKLNNSLSNLEWATDSENHKHAYATNLRKSIRVLSENEVKTIYNRFLNHEPFAHMLQEFGISAGTLSYWINKYVTTNNLKEEYKAEVLYQIRHRAKQRKTSTTISKESTPK